jgi:hypothetical protein
MRIPTDFPPGDPLPLPVVATTLAIVGGYEPIAVYGRLDRGIQGTPGRRGVAGAPPIPPSPPTIQTVVVAGEAMIPRAEAQRLLAEVQARRRPDPGSDRPGSERSDEC